MLCCLWLKGSVQVRSEVALVSVIQLDGPTIGDIWLETHSAALRWWMSTPLLLFCPSACLNNLIDPFWSTISSQQRLQTKFPPQKCCRRVSLFGFLAGSVFHTTTKCASICSLALITNGLWGMWMYLVLQVQDKETLDMCWTIMRSLNAFNSLWDEHGYQNQISKCIQ